MYVTDTWTDSAVTYCDACVKEQLDVYRLRGTVVAGDDVTAGDDQATDPDSVTTPNALSQPPTSRTTNSDTEVPEGSADEASQHGAGVEYLIGVTQPQGDDDVGNYQQDDVDNDDDIDQQHVKSDWDEEQWHTASTFYESVSHTAEIFFQRH